MGMMDVLQTMGGAAGILKFVMPGESKDTKSASKPKEEESGNMIMNFLKRLGGKDKSEAEKVQETAEAERAGIFTEAISSVLVRYFPKLSKITTLASAAMDKVGIRKRNPESHEWQNEIDNFTALTLFIPDRILKNATDLFVKSEYFLKLIEFWPGMPKNMIDEIKKEKYDPDFVINILRVISQDISTGKVAADKVAGLFGANGLMDLAKKAIS
jgi:hypothetical protein